MSFQEENDKLVSHFLEKTFFKAWRSRNGALANWRRVELFLNTRCNQACVYCYLNRYGSKLYPEQLQDDRAVLSNLRMFLDWLTSKSYKPDFEIFSGEPLVQEIGYRALEMILRSYLRHKLLPVQVVVPSNYTFILNNHLTSRVIGLLRTYHDCDSKLILSTSIDGKYCESNRPLKSLGADPRDDKFYDRVFSFNRRFGFGFHPMVYSRNIECWIDNFVWFQDMFRKHRIPYYNLYLLEVRNKEWSPASIRGFGEFVSFIIKWTWKHKCGENRAKFLDFLFRFRGYNMLQSPFSTIGRGIGCSIQGTFTLRVGDLCLVPCHRTAYRQFELARFKTSNGRISGLEAINPELMITIYTLHSNNFPYCESCPIKNLCSKGCLGSQFEATGDLFTPIPTVCQLEHWKLYNIIKTFKEIGVLPIIKERTTPDKRFEIEFIEREIRR